MTSCGIYPQVSSVVFDGLNFKTNGVRKVMSEIEKKKRCFLGCWTDAVSNVCYYDRKNCEDLSVDDVKLLIGGGNVSIGEILAAVEKELRDNYDWDESKQVS